jgi:hypothetical protein
MLPLTSHDKSDFGESPEWVDDERGDQEHLHVVVQVPRLPDALKKCVSLPCTLKTNFIWSHHKLFYDVTQ